MALMKLVRSRRGRPQKFGRPSRALTLTLPEDVIAALTSINDDVSRAVVGLVQPLNADVVPRPPAELSKHGDSSVIVIRPSLVLKRMAGVRLVPLADGRALISLDEGLSVQAFELRVRDALDNASMAARDRSILASVVDILREARHTRGVAVHQRNIIVLQSTGRRRIAPRDLTAVKN
jgi:hypothetical protein